MKGDVTTYSNVHVYDDAKIEIESITYTDDESLVWIRLGEDQKTNIYLTEPAFLSLVFQVNAFVEKSKVEARRINNETGQEILAPSERDN